MVLGQFIRVKFQGRVEKKCLYIFPRLVITSGPITTDYVDGLGSVISIQTSKRMLSLHYQHFFVFKDIYPIPYSYLK